MRYAVVVFDGRRFYDAMNPDASIPLIGRGGIDAGPSWDPPGLLSFVNDLNKIK